MSTISVRVNEDESKLIHEYVAINQLNLSQFLRETILGRIEDDLRMDEHRIMQARKRAKHEKKYDHTQVWEMLGV